MKPQFVAWLLLLLLTAVSAYADRPNIVVFLTDDQGQLDSQPYGATYLKTPNMQRLAEAGMLFTDAYVASGAPPGNVPAKRKE